MSFTRGLDYYVISWLRIILGSIRTTDYYQARVSYIDLALDL